MRTEAWSPSTGESPVPGSLSNRGKAPPATTEPECSAGVPRTHVGGSVAVTSVGGGSAQRRRVRSCSSTGQSTTFRRTNSSGRNPQFDAQCTQSSGGAAKRDDVAALRVRGMPTGPPPGSSSGPPTCGVGELRVVRERRRRFWTWHAGAGAGCEIVLLGVTRGRPQNGHLFRTGSGVEEPEPAGWPAVG